LVLSWTFLWSYWGIMAVACSRIPYFCQSEKSKLKHFKENESEL
jgi:hypothetical protein